MHARTAWLVVVSSTFVSCGTAPRPPAAAKTESRAPRPQAASIPSFEAKDIDLALRQEWTRAGIEPAPRVDDARWLRRVYIDVVGTIPPPSVITSFVADAAPDKRAKMVDGLLASPQYAEHWMNYWDDELLGRDARGQDLDRGAFRRWLRTRFRDNAAWDSVVVELVSAV